MPKRRKGQSVVKSVTKTGRKTTTPERHIVVLFADIIGCSEISNHKSLSQYNEFLEDFHKIFHNVVEDNKLASYDEHEKKYFKADVRGDEGNLMIFVPGRDDLSADVDAAINIGLDLKRRWLLSPDNTIRIKESGLLPSDLAIGIHVGKAYINENQSGEGVKCYRPEGYAINLTKRIEGCSRDGRFTRIFVSEAARGELYLLTDEMTYTFADPYPFTPKGISREIRVFEIKHHFLPTDWADLRGPVVRSKAVDFRPTEENIKQIFQAYQANPTNLWLAEEYIMLALQYGYHRLRDAGNHEDPIHVRKEYKEAELVCRRLATGDQRDAGILTTAGFIAGEYQDYAEEQRLYKEALSLDDQFAEAYWYLGYSMSFELNESLHKDGREKVLYSDLPENEKDRVQKILQSFEKAIELNPRQSWIHFDLACELCRWRKKSESIEKLEHAVSLNPSIRHYIKDEPYLESIIDNQRVQKLIEDR